MILQYLPVNVGSNPIPRTNREIYAYQSMYIILTRVHVLKISKEALKSAQALYSDNEPSNEQDCKSIVYGFREGVTNNRTHVIKNV